MQLFLLIHLIFWQAQSPKLVRVNVGDDISIKVPDSFTLIPEGQMINRHVHFRRPLALYTDPNNDVDLSFNQNPTRWRESDIDILKDFYKSNILSLYDDVEFSKEAIEEIRGKKYAVFEFVSSIKGDQNSIRNTGTLRKYTYIQYTVYQGSTLVVNFTSSIKTKQRWTPVAKEIMGSISLK